MSQYVKDEFVIDKIAKTMDESSEFEEQGEAFQRGWLCALLRLESNFKKGSYESAIKSVNRKAISKEKKGE